jgi:hypothetical protein
MISLFAPHALSASPWDVKTPERRAEIAKKAAEKRWSKEAVD